MPEIIPMETITSKIYLLRGLKVMLDRDLANLYQVETRVLKQAVRRNKKRFPDDFMFELTKDEEDSLRSQIVILKGRGQHSKYHAFAFTEQQQVAAWYDHNNDIAAFCASDPLKIPATLPTSRP